MKKISFLFLLPFYFLFFGCPCNCAPIDEYCGKYISNFPTWIRYSELVCASCEWKAWQSDAGKKLHEFMPKDLNFSDFNGNYRLIPNGQNIILFFDDENRTYVNLFYIFVSKAEEFGDTIRISQTDDSEFVFSGWAKYYDFDELSSENIAHVTYKIIDKTENGTKGRFCLELKNTLLIDEEFFTLAGNQIKPLDYPSSFPTSFVNNSMDLSYNLYFEKKYCYGFINPAWYLRMNNESLYRQNQILYQYDATEIYSQNLDSLILHFTDGSDKMPAYVKISKREGNSYLFEWFKTLGSESMRSETMYSLKHFYSHDEN